MKILLTGHKGFLGHEIMEVLMKENAIEIQGLDCDNDFNTFQAMFEEFVSGERSDAPNFNYVIHCGALADSEAKGNAIWQLNYEATVQIADYCNSTHTKLLFISSAAAIEPDTPYGWSKRCAEGYVRSKINIGHWCILRPYNIWGFDESQKSNPSIVYKILSGDLEKVYEGCVRDFVYISDIVSAVQQVIHSWRSGVFSLGSAEGIAIADLVDQIGPNTLPVGECPIKKRLVADKGQLLPNWEADSISEHFVYLRECAKERGCIIAEPRPYKEHVPGERLRLDIN